MKFAPDGAAGVLLVEPKALARDLLAAIAKEPEFKSWDANMLAAIGRFAGKIESLDLFAMPPASDDKRLGGYLVVIRGALRAADVNALLRALEGGEGDVLQKKGDEKGRYEFESDKIPLEFVFGGDANDLPAGVVLAGIEERVAPKALAALGKGKHEDLDKLLKDVDTAAPVWGAALAGKLDWGKDAFSWIAGGVYLTGGGPCKVAMQFADANGAEKQLADLLADANAGDGWSKFLTTVAKPACEGSRLTLSGKSKDSLVPAMVAAWAESRKAEKRDESLMLLREIGGEMVVYSADHDDLLPADLLVMVKDKALPAGALVSPVSGRTVKTDDKGLPEAGFESDYLCVKYPMPLHKIKESKPKVLAYERPENYKNEGTAVLYVDGHVEFVKLDEFNKQLKATQDWIAAQPKDEKKDK